MSEVVRAAIVQTAWTGDKQSMIDKNADYARQAAEQGAQAMCFQELFYAPYFCQVQEDDHFDYAEPIPDGDTTQQMIALAKETGMVIVVPIFEMQDHGHYYNTAAVIDADGTYLGKYRKTHIPHVNGFWEKYYFRPGNTGYPIFDTKVGRIGVYICYDRHFPEGWRALGLAGAKIVFNPSATSRGLGSSYFVDPRGEFVGAQASDTEEELVVRDLDMSMIDSVRKTWAFYRDRRPDAYGDLVAP